MVSLLFFQLIRTSPALTVVFSSYTIALIAMDRHRFIVLSTRRQVNTYYLFLDLPK